MIVLSFPPEASLVSPGPLCKQHAQTPNGCADCHRVGGGGLNAVVAAAIYPDSHNVESQKCLVCHQEIGSYAMNPHSSDSGTLASLTQSPRPGDANTDLVTWLAKAAFGSPNPTGEIHCATCHKEHQGANHDLKLLGNRQCQVCHVESFHSFEHGHPEFDSYPYRRRTRIYFDHTSHYGRHFSDATTSGQADVSCATCHVTDSTGMKMEIRGYDVSCGRCHEEQIKDDLVPGIVVAAVPDLDSESMADRGFDPGIWPQGFPLHASAKSRIPALTKLLLSEDPRFRQISEQVDRINLPDLRAASDEELQTAQELAWLLKEYLYRRIQDSPTRPEELVSNRLLQPLLDRIPSEKLLDLQKRWFPELQKEMVARETGQAFELVEPIGKADLSQIVKDQEMHGRSIRNGWYLQDSDLTLRYRPTGHADPVLVSLLELAADIESDRSIDDAMRSIADDFFDVATSPFNAGRCTKCHTLDKQANETRINWRGGRRSSNRKPFTQFRHSPHLNSSSNSECLSCHSYAPSGKPSDSIFRTGFIDLEGNVATDSTNCMQEFSPMGKQQCSKCHQKDAAGDSCLDCHTYHIR